MRITRWEMAMVTLTAITSAAYAPPAAAQAPVVQGAEVTNNNQLVVQQLTDILEKTYGSPDKVSKVRFALHEELAKGRYSGVAGRDLAERLKSDMQAAAGDQHLSIIFDPGRAGMLSHQKSGGGMDLTALDRMAAARNYGFSEMRVLDGNIRYTKLDGMVWTGQKTSQAYDHALQFLRGGNASIIDLRHTRLGSPEALAYLLSKLRHASAVTAERAISHRPLYVLTTSMTVSSAEELAAMVTSENLGQVVGQKTGGVSNRQEMHPIHGGFVLSFAKSGEGRDGGVAPTIPAEPGRELEHAQLHALRTMASALPADEQPLLERLATVLEAKVNGSKPELPIQAYAGSFGDRVVSVENGALQVQRVGGPRSSLLTLGPNLFVLEADPDTRLKFAVKDGSAQAVEVIRANGTRILQPRTQ